MIKKWLDYWYDDYDEKIEELYDNPFGINPYYLELILTGQADFVICPQCDGTGYQEDNICLHCLGNKIMLIPLDEDKLN